MRERAHSKQEPISPAPLPRQRRGHLASLGGVSGMAHTRGRRATAPLANLAFIIILHAMLPGRAPFALRIHIPILAPALRIVRAQLQGGLAVVLLDVRLLRQEGRLVGAALAGVARLVAGPRPGGQPQEQADGVAATVHRDNYAWC